MGQFHVFWYIWFWSINLSVGICLFKPQLSIISDFTFLSFFIYLIKWLNGCCQRIDQTQTTNCPNPTRHLVRERGQISRKKLNILTFPQNLLEFGIPFHEKLEKWSYQHEIVLAVLGLRSIFSEKVLNLEFPQNELEFGISLHETPEKWRYHEKSLWISSRNHANICIKMAKKQSPKGCI